jgi:hypothetical protein
MPHKHVLVNLMCPFLFAGATVVRLYVIIHIEGCLTCEHNSSYKITVVITALCTFLRTEYAQKYARVRTCLSTRMR